MKEIKAEIQLQPARELYPIFAYRKQHLPTLCKLFRTAEKCIGVNMLSRCRTQEKTLNALEVLLEPICRRNELSFVDHFDCLNNLLKENENLRYCTRDALNSIITTESAANMDGSRKRLEKCETFNKLLECSRSSIVEKCSQAHWQLFLFAIQSSLPSTAPECYVSDKNNRIAPIDNNYKPPFEVPEKFPVFTNNSGVTDSYETTSNPATQLLLNTTSSFISSISTGNTEITGSTGSTSNNNSTSHSSAILTTTTPITTTSLKETTATTSQPLVTTKNLVDENSIFVNKGTTLSQIVGDIQSTTSTQTSTIRQTTSSSTSKKTIVSPPGRIPDETKTSGKESPETPESNVNFS